MFTSGAILCIIVSGVSSAEHAILRLENPKESLEAAKASRVISMNVRECWDGLSLSSSCDGCHLYLKSGS